MKGARVSSFSDALFVTVLCVVGTIILVGTNMIAIKNETDVVAVVVILCLLFVFSYFVNFDSSEDSSKGVNQEPGADGVDKLLSPIFSPFHVSCARPCTTLSEVSA